MPRQKINIVWLKRDFRLRDHAAFFQAEQSKLPYLILCIIEPSIIAHPDSSLRHLQFVYHSVVDMNHVLSKVNKQIQMVYGEAKDVFENLITEFDVQEIFSYQESGIRITWTRDKEIAQLLELSSVGWQEFQRDAIIRGIQNRNGWDKAWKQHIFSPQIKNSYSERDAINWSHNFKIPKSLKADLEDYPSSFQPPGEDNAWKYLNSFVKDRGRNYAYHISSPSKSRTSCGRISPYLAWGNLSIKQAYQFVKYHENYKEYKFSFDGFLTRLKWHCHFIQKFEVECDYETLCLNQGYELLEHDNEDHLLEAWRKGETGFPLIDACMRCVINTGWINFRMRAMLVSMLSQHFDQDWRRGVYHLAQQFLDYEPGIHYPQFQMQAGTTGINTVRMYNPIKQSQDNDSEGKFIKKWVPELRDVPEEFIHEPWKMTPMDQAFCNVIIGEHYPFPVINFKDASKAARDKIWGHKKHPAVVAEKKRIIVRHTRNEFSEKRR